MVEMRVYDKLQAKNLSDFEYTWDKAYSEILMRQDLNTNVRLESDQIFYHYCTTPGGTATCTSLSYHAGSVSCSIVGNRCHVTGTFYIDFIFPFKYSYKMILDGIADGYMAINTVTSASGLDALTLTPNIILYARDSSGTDRTLASTTLKDVPFPVIGQQYIPFFIDIDNQIIDYDERLIVRFSFDIDMTSGSSANETYVYLLNTINTDENYINLPVVS